MRSIAVLILLSICSSSFSQNDTIFLNNGKYDVGTFLNEKKEGVWHRYFPDGKLERNEFYIKGEADKEWEDFYPNGELALSLIHI